MASSGFARDIRTHPQHHHAVPDRAAGHGRRLYFNGHETAGIVLAIIAGLTDYLDGAVARATGQVTRLGEILDQFCDLCYEASVLSVAIHSKFFPPWIILVYLFREFWVVSIRRYAAGRGDQHPQQPGGQGEDELSHVGLSADVPVASAACSPGPSPGWPVPAR